MEEPKRTVVHEPGRAPEEKDVARVKAHPRQAGGGHVGVTVAKHEFGAVTEREGDDRTTTRPFVFVLV
jgi:hypothetical protein